MELTPDVAEMLLQLTLCAFVVYVVGCLARFFWLTRRQPVRPDAPTGDEPWITPHPNDDTPVA